MYPTINLQPGQRGPEVEKLQNFLMSQGLLTQEQINTGPGIYGPQTKQAVTSWQEINGVDNTSGPGYWGPQSIGVASGGITGPVDGVTGDPVDEEQPYSDEEYSLALNNNPIVAESVAKGNTVEDLAYAAESGDFSGLVNQFGQPFSLEEQQKALADAEADNSLYFKALESKETADAESTMAQQKADYQNYLLNSGQNFEADKAQSDESAASRGVLFSGGRVQKEKNMVRAYDQDQASKLDTASRNIGNTARDFQYKYGNDATNNLSSNYSLGGNTFNANKATGGVSSNGLSSIYNPSQYNYQGTQNVAKKTAANTRAAGKLWNKGNKLLSTSYNNQY